MQKYLSFLLCLCVLLALLAGCVVSKDPTDTTKSENTEPTGETLPPIPEDLKMPTVDEDYFEFLCRYCDISYRLDATRASDASFYLLSMQSLTGKTLTVETNLGGGETIFSEIDNNAYTVPLAVFMTYQGVDWKTLAANPEAAAETEEYWYDIYKQVKSDLPTLYVTQVSLPLEMLGINTENPTELQKIEYIAVTFDGKTKTYSDIGTFVALAGKYDVSQGSGKLFSNQVLSVGYLVDPSAEGLLNTPYGWAVTAKKDVVLESLSVLENEAIELVSCNLKISSPISGTVEMEWDGVSPLELDEGSKIKITATFRDSALAGRLEGVFTRVLAVNFTCDSESYSLLYPMYCRINANPFCIYAKDVDGIDMMDYYRDYLEVIYAA